MILSTNRQQETRKMINGYPIQEGDITGFKVGLFTVLLCTIERDCSSQSPIQGDSNLGFKFVEE